jgi:hypothetical protein
VLKLPAALLPVPQATEKDPLSLPVPQLSARADVGRSAKLNAATSIGHEA